MYMGHCHSSPELKVKVIGQGRGQGIKDDNAVGLTSILDRWQFFSSEIIRSVSLATQTHWTTVSGVEITYTCCVWRNQNVPQRERRRATMTSRAPAADDDVIITSRVVMATGLYLRVCVLGVGVLFKPGYLCRRRIRVLSNNTLAVLQGRSSQSERNSQ